MSYEIKFSQAALRSLNQLDETTRDMIFAWIFKNLVDTTKPREIGLPLKGKLKGLWRYRIGKYRILAKIDDRELIILVIDIGHRRRIYLT
jgi:mRNA interferase RelE/StbE